MTADEEMKTTKRINNKTKQKPKSPWKLREGERKKTKNLGRAKNDTSWAPWRLNNFHGREIATMKASVWMQTNTHVISVLHDLRASVNFNIRVWGMVNDYVSRLELQEHPILWWSIPTTLLIKKDRVRNK